jgi:uncharacterized protein (DUF488 family)
MIASESAAPARKRAAPRGIVFTIGHSTRPLAELLDLLKGHDVVTLIDVRTVPRSRHNPQFNGDALAASLPSEGIEYAQAPGLGGFRPTSPASPNQGWRNLSFRGYADYMQTPDFAENLYWLMRLADREPVAIMCAEAVPWRCHRSLIADALGVHGVAVEEIVAPHRTQPHRLTPFARVEGTRITYPPDEPTVIPSGARARPAR